MERKIAAENLLNLRNGKTREEVAEEIGISVSTLQMYENAKRIPRDSIKVKLANFYGVTVQSIFFDYQQHEVCCSARCNKEVNYD
ncbi:helix-turn-helix transcriptional regulator [Bacillus cereus]|uniref:helix-turn-helix transcriptional regulator n=1 Tax=Bacillus cereus group TaxID=86661 RepID=UPI000BFDDE4A|nr:helix-turn-helix transcriptional regulator [Bacillus cereus]MCJ0846344.1 helix-turn-helix transcriptional regulator [Bacillus cereus]PGQ74947.1 transcriptional regulator [Bacillus cereus]HDR4881570.1 helix-turn-helix transcriptional regulator [Bacillus cereus]